MLPKMGVKQFEKTIFFIMMWVFYSLNSRYFRIPMAELFRWAFLGGLIFCVLMIEKAKLPMPPRLVIFFLIAIIPSAFVAADLSEAIIKPLSFVVVVWGSYIYFSSLKTKNDFDSVMKIVMAIMILFEVQSLITIAMGTATVGDRMQGITTNPNTLGIYSNVALIASFYWFIRTKKWKKLLFFLLMLAAVYMAIESGSRTAFVTVMVNIVLCLFLQIKNGPARLLLVIFIAVFGTLLLSGRFGDFGSPALQKLIEGDVTRDELWEKGIEVWRRFPVFGCGYANSQLYNNVPGEEGLPFHNSYLTILAETGIWGVLILALALFFEFKDIFKVYLKMEKEEKLSIFQIAILFLIELAIAAWSESFLFAVGSTEACTFWVVFMWVVAYMKNMKKKEWSNGANT